MAEPFEPTKPISDDKQSDNQHTDAIYAELVRRLQERLGVNALTADQQEALRRAAREYGNKSIHEIVNSRSFTFQMDSWASSAATLPARKTAKSMRQSLAGLTNLDSASLRRGSIEMGEADVLGLGGPKTILYTTGVGGCIAVVVAKGTTYYLAHYLPNQLKGEPNETGRELENTIAGVDKWIGGLSGAQVWLCSPSATSSYSVKLKTVFTNRGATIVAEFLSDTLAVTLDGTILHDFSA